MGRLALLNVGGRLTLIQLICFGLFEPVVQVILGPADISGDGMDAGVETLV